MVSPFIENIPSPNSALVSSEIRDNFSALYDKVKTLEVQSYQDSTSIRILSGPVYFRSGSDQQLKLVKFPEIILDLNQATSYKTTKDAYGVISRSLQSFKGLSSFQSEGPLMEILVSANANGQVVITESTSAQNNKLSSPYNIFFDDSEIPLSLIFVEKNSEGTLQVVTSTDISEVRPVITTAFQNNEQVSAIENSLNDTIERVSALEPSAWSTDNLKLRFIPTTKLTADGTTTTNTKVEVLSGKAFVNGMLLTFAGGYVDFAIGSTTNTALRTYTAGTTTGSALYWRRALVSLEYNASTGDVTDNAILRITHGTENASPSGASKPSLPANNYPIGYVLYRSMIPATSIYPILDSALVDAVRVSYEFAITNMTILPSGATVEFLIDVGTAVVYSDFSAADDVEIFDSNTRPIRRKIQSSSAYATGIIKIIVTNSFVDIDLARSPKFRWMKSGKHQQIIES